MDDHNKKKKKKLKKLYEFETYNSDDKLNDEPLLTEDDKEQLFINNSSMTSSRFNLNFIDKSYPSKNFSRFDKRRDKFFLSDFKVICSIIFIFIFIKNSSYQILK